MDQDDEPNGGPSAPAGPDSTGALRGVRVVEFGQYVAAPVLGMLLADQQAEIIKIERPGGDPARALPAFATWNRGKKSVVLDLKSDAGQAAARSLIADADIVIENFAPDVARRLRIDHAGAAAINPRVIHCALPAFGRFHPEHSRAGWDPVITTLMGVHSSHSFSDGMPMRDERPLYTPMPLASLFAAVTGAGAVAAALLARDRFGISQEIEVSLHSAMFAAMGVFLVKIDGVPIPVLPKLPMSLRYRCADGRYVQLQGIGERFVRTFLTVAGRPEWIDDAVPAELVGTTERDMRLWIERFEQIFASRPAQEWEDAINAAGGVCCVCRTVDEWLDNGHAAEAGLVVTVTDCERGPVKQPGVAVNLGLSAGAVRGRAPLVGEHTRSVLAAAGASTQARAQPAAPAQPGRSALDGIRVLDLSIILAGPTCGRTLAEFGADVIKIDDPARTQNEYVNLDINRGKRSMLLDLKSPAGRDVFWRLLQDADVVVENYRAGKLEELGLDYASVARRKPDIIYASLNAFGYGGPWTSRGGYEQNAQSATGITVRRGGREGRPLSLTYPINDYGTGLLGAYGVMLAVRHRLRTGLGQRVTTSLVQSAGVMQSGFMFDYAGYRRDEPEGPALLGDHALSHFYRASDEWFFLFCADEVGWRRLIDLPDFAGIAGDERFATARERRDHDRALRDALADIFSRKPVDTWISVLDAAGIDAVRRFLLPDLHRDPFVRRAGLVPQTRLQDGAVVDHIGAATALLSATPKIDGRLNRHLGCDTRAILDEAGYDAASIDRLLASGAAAAA